MAFQQDPLRYTYTDLVYNLPYLRLEAHVQHPVGLVQHQVCAPAQVGLPRLQEVDEPAGRGDTDLHT